MQNKVKVKCAPTGETYLEFTADKNDESVNNVALYRFITDLGYKSSWCQLEIIQDAVGEPITVKIHPITDEKILDQVAEMQERVK